MPEYNYKFDRQTTRCFPLILGDVTINVQSWQLSGQRVFAEQSSADGGCVFTNDSQRSRRIILEGIIITDSPPETVLLLIDGYIANSTAFDFNLRGMIFRNARMVKYTAEENGGEPYIKLRLELISSAPSKEADTQ